MEVSRSKNYKKLKVIILLSIVVLVSVFVLFELFQNNNTNIEEIEVHFMPPFPSSPTPITKEDVIDFEYGYFSKISSKDSVLLLIEKNLNKLEVSDDQSSYDVIIVCKIIRKNGESEELLLGSSWGTTLNGKRMKDNVELNYLIKSEIGFYDLIDYDYLDRVKDLKDPLKLNKVKANYRKEKRYDRKNVTP